MKSKLYESLEKEFNLSNNVKNVLDKENSSILDKAINIASKTIGSSIVDVKSGPTPKWVWKGSKKKPKIDPSCERVYETSYYDSKTNTNVSEWVVTKYDYENELITTPRFEFDPYKPEDFAKLDDVDIKKLEHLLNFYDKSEIVHKVYKSEYSSPDTPPYEYDIDLYNKKGMYSCWLRGNDHLHISSSPGSWMALAGRHYIYNLTTKELTCIAMS